MYVPYVYVRASQQAETHRQARRFLDFVGERDPSCVAAVLTTCRPYLDSQLGVPATHLVLRLAFLFSFTLRTAFCISSCTNSTLHEQQMRLIEVPRAHRGDCARRHRLCNASAAAMHAHLAPCHMRVALRAWKCKHIAPTKITLAPVAAQRLQGAPSRRSSRCPQWRACTSPSCPRCGRAWLHTESPVCRRRA